MRTYVPMTREYLISHRDRKHPVLFSSPDLTEIALELTRRENRAFLTVDASEGMGYRTSLNEQEQIQLDAALRVR